MRINNQVYQAKDGQQWVVNYNGHTLTVKNETGPIAGPNFASNWWELSGHVGAGQTPVRGLLDLWKRGGFELPADLKRYIISLFPA